MPERPLVGIVVVNFNGGGLTMRCLQRLHELTWPAERTRIVLVDNGSQDGIPDAVRQRWPDVVVIETRRNLGFGGACNRGFDVLPDVDYVALVNNDAVPEPDWLEPLVDALESDPGLGAATPKVLLTGTWVELRVTSDASRVGGDPRDLGVQIGGVLVDGVDRRSEVLWREGTWGMERTGNPIGPIFQWTDGDAVGLVPVPPAGAQLSVQLSGNGVPRHVEVAASGRCETASAENVIVVDLGRVGPGRSAINNVGVLLCADGSASDRGYLHLDNGGFDTPIEVAAWSGAAVLLRRRYLDEVGGFDEPLFLYYEDVDLSLRGRASGWRFRYCPSSTVHHEHSATVSRVGDLTRHLSARNRLLVLVKHAPLDVVVRGFAEFVRNVWRTLLVDVVARRRRGQPAAPEELRRLLRVGLGVGRRLPRSALHRLTHRTGGWPLLDASRTERSAYTDRLAASESLWWKRALDVQRPYRWNLRRLQPGLTLDVGCGIGRNLGHLDGAGVGVDHNPTSIQVCRERGYEAYTPDEFDGCRASKSSFDSVLLAHVAEHMDEAAAIDLLQHYVHHVRPGGKVIVITPQEAATGVIPPSALHGHGRVLGKVFRYNEFVVVGRLPD